MGEVIIRYVNLPLSVKAYTLTDPNDDFNIYINSNHSIDEQEKAKAHELSHIEKGHFFNGQSASMCESEV